MNIMWLKLSKGIYVYAMVATNDLLRYTVKILENIESIFEYCRGTDGVVTVVLESMYLNFISLVHSAILF